MNTHIKFFIIGAIFLLNILTVTGQNLLQQVYPNHYTYWKIQKSSQLKINGATNINKFKCRFESPELSDTLSLLLNYEKTNVEFNHDELLINVKSFDCFNPLITHDFRKTLQADIHPNIHIQFLNLEFTPDLDPDSIRGNITIMLAGVRKEYTINYKIANLKNNVWSLLGTKQLAFSEFGLEPPTRLMQLIKVKDELNISFDLQLKQIYVVKDFIQE